uniref:F-box domain-containing protein n=1 Tax=Panagrellus redivivus TaxID=6233 RepID=A0A7E4VVB9_PANRE
MVYQIAKLPYGLRRRLGELGTPAERFNLQHAAGDVAICPPKLQSVHFENDCFIRYENGALIVSQDRIVNKPFITDENSDALFCPSWVTIAGVNPEDISFDFKPNFIMEPESMTLRKCSYSANFFMDLASKIDTSSVQFLQVFQQTGSNVLKIADLFANFPKLTCLSLSNVVLSSTWMRDILKSQKRRLDSLSITGPVEAELDICELVTFFNKQQRNFSFYMNVNDAEFPALKKSLARKFLRRKPENATRKLTINKTEVFYLNPKFDFFAVRTTRKQNKESK